MEQLEEAIREYGIVLDGDTLKVDSFLNHQMDIKLLDEMAKIFYEHYQHETITKIMTVETSGIAIAALTARYFGVPVLYAKKGNRRNIEGDCYTANVTSFSHQRNYEVVVSKKFLTADDHILIIDDLLSRGSSLLGLIDIIEQAGANIVGAGICVEKAFEDGGAKVRSHGVKVLSLAKIEYMDENRIVFND